MANKDYVDKLTEYLIKEYHGPRIEEQEKDQSFYDGSFAKNLELDVRDIYVPSTGARMINKPAAHLVTSNPQAFRLPRKIGEVESAAMVAKFLNYYLGYLKRQNPNPIPQNAKTNMKRGEVWTQIVLNEAWRRNKSCPKMIGKKVCGAKMHIDENNPLILICPKCGCKHNCGEMPVYLRIPDPMVIFASPKEHNGIPEEVIVSYERSVRDIQNYWPDFEPKDPNAKRVKWLEYCSSKERYFEADGEPVLDFQPNILGFVPLVHAYSGFGSESPEMKPELLAVGALRYVRDLLEEKCAIASDLRSGVHRHVFPPIILHGTVVGYKLPEDQFSKINLGPYEGTFLPAEVEWVTPPNFMPPQEAFQHYANINAEIREVMSPVFEGGAIGQGSGRYRDLTKTDALAPYNSILKATETSFTTALGLILRILDTVPDMLPITVRSTMVEKGVSLRKEEILKKSDIGGYYDCEVLLRPEDPLHKDRNATLYAKYFLDGLIDIETCLVEGFGKTQSQAKEIIKRVMIDAVTIKSPMFTQTIGLQLAQETGMMEPFMQAMAMSSPMKGKSPRPGEVQTPQGAEMVDTSSLMERGIRERQGNA